MAKMLNVSIKNRTNLYKSYMSFLKNGGIFVELPSTKEYKIGDEVLAVLDIMESEQKFPLQTKIVWLSNKNHPIGVGLAFDDGDIASQAKTFIEKNLVGLLKHHVETFTM